MSKDEQLREIQKRIAEARGWHSIIYWDVYGRLQGMDGSGGVPDLVPLWPQEWCACGWLVDEMRTADEEWYTYRMDFFHDLGWENSHRFVLQRGSRTRRKGSVFARLQRWP